MKLQFLVLATLASGFGCASAADDASSSSDELRGRPNLLIADQYNNRVIEVDAHHNVVWSFGNESSVAGAHSVVAPNDAQRVGSFTLISGTGAPAGAEPKCKKGCNDSRVLLVDDSGNIVWQYGKAGVVGAGADELNAPVAAVYLPTDHVLITDQGNARVIEVDPSNNTVVWSYGLSSDTSILNGPAFASRLPNGNTLISDAGNNRIVEVTKNSKKTVFSFVTNTRKGSNANPNPTRAVRLKNGDTLISDQNNHQVIEVDSKGKIVFSQGKINVPGKGQDELNGPYDAKAIGDFTGLTSPGF